VFVVDTSATIGCESETQKCDSPSTSAGIPDVSSIPDYSRFLIIAAFLIKATFLIIAAFLSIAAFLTIAVFKISMRCLVKNRREKIHPKEIGINDFN
jgi:uncharacterized protein involved in exopolysaccharide biosynthesis